MPKIKTPPPVSHQSLKRQASTQSHTPPENFEKYDLRILVVEDNPLNLSLIMRVLKKVGCTVAETCEDGASALQITATQKFDVMFLDVNLPDVSGIDITRIIRSNGRQEDEQPYIIAFTANSLSGDYESYLACGMDAMISKPFSQRDLTTQLEHYVSMYKK